MGDIKGASSFYIVKLITYQRTYQFLIDYGEKQEFTTAAGVYHITHDGESGSIWAIVKRGGSRMVLHLINLIDQMEDKWNVAKSNLTTKLSLTLQILRYSKQVMNI